MASEPQRELFEVDGPERSEGFSFVVPVHMAIVIPWCATWRATRQESGNVLVELVPETEDSADG